MNEQQLKIRAWKIGTSLGAILIALIAVFIIKELASISHVGDAAPVNTITVSGTGNAYAVPNIATFTFTVSDTEKTVADAQSKVTAAENKAIAVVKSAGVSDADIQTTLYNISPQYQYQNAICPQQTSYNTSANSASVSSGLMVPTVAAAPATAIYCPPGKSVLTGYEVSETVQVKLRDLSKSGSLLASLGGAGVSNLNGPDFSVDNPDAVNAQARDKAITDAQAKAKTLASELGVSLGKVTNFSEDNGSYPRPVMYAAMASTGSAKSAAPEISTGQNQFTSNVTITYEIK
ncbi:MAG: SIMPL domain-containing protein [Patescibacteria group bacterium]|nr:SIMPL domain-containing protein [Patescibacteria group bacterium]